MFRLIEAVSRASSSTLLAAPLCDREPSAAAAALGLTGRLRSRPEFILGGLSVACLRSKTRDAAGERDGRGAAGSEMAGSGDATGAGGSGRPAASALAAANRAGSKSIHNTRFTSRSERVKPSSASPRFASEAAHSPNSTQLQHEARSSASWRPTVSSPALLRLLASRMGCPALLQPTSNLGRQSSDHDDVRRSSYSASSPSIHGIRSMLPTLRPAITLLPAPIHALRWPSKAPRRKFVY